MNEPNDVLGRVLAGGRIRSEQEARVVREAVAAYERVTAYDAPWRTALAATGIEDPAEARDWLEGYSEDFEAFRADRDDSEVWSAIHAVLEEAESGPATYRRRVAARTQRDAESGPAAYRRNLPSMSPAAPASGGLSDTTASGPKAVRR